MSAHPQPPEFDDGIPSYLTRLTQAPLLTPDEEVALTRAVQAGDRSAKQRLIECNMRLVINIAKTYRNRSVPLEDLIQEGAIGMMAAAERFDPEKGFRFSTYATHWIRQAIGRAIDNKSKAIRLPAHISQSVRKIERERTRLAGELGREPTAEQVAEAMGISPKRLATLLQSAQELLSLDMTVGENGGVTLGGLIKDNSNGDPESVVLGKETIEELQHILLELNEREQRVMRLRFMLDGADPPLQEEVAKDMQISRERVRQIEMRAIKKLRDPDKLRRLRNILNG